MMDTRGSKMSTFNQNLLGRYLLGIFHFQKYLMERLRPIHSYHILILKTKDIFILIRLPLTKKNADNINGDTPEIWHGVISPNTGIFADDVTQLRAYLDKNHDFYE